MLNLFLGEKTWKKYYLARNKVETGSVTGRPGLDYVCKSLRGHRGLVSDVIFITTNDIYDESIVAKSAYSVIASCGQDKTVGLWNAREGKSLWRKSEGHESAVSCLALIKPSELFVSGDQTGIANLWDVTTGQCNKLPEEHNGSIAKMSTGNADQLFIASRSGVVKLWDVKDTSESQLTIQSPLLGLSMMLVKNETVILAGSDNVFNSTPGIKVYDIRNLAPEGFRARPHDFQQPNGSLNHQRNSTVTCLCWIPGKPHHIAAGYKDGSITIWDVKNLSESYSCKPHVGSVTAISAVGTKVISAGTECSLSVWDLDAKKSLGSFIDHNSMITDLYADAYKVMSCSRDFSIRVYSWVNKNGVRGLSSKYTLLGGSLQRAGKGFEKVVCDYATCVGMANDVMKAYSFQV